MKKKIILAMVALVAVSLGVVGMSAFEAHIINVTAHIENALTIPVEADGMSFGTVFPEEVSFQNMDIQLSNSFLATPRVDDIEYMIRQKPKCGVPIPGTNPIAYSSHPQVTENNDGGFICPDGSVMLPLLCPYLSKHEVGTTTGIDAFHGPITNWTMTDTLATQVTGRLSKADNKTSTSWVIDLHAPCFKGMCAQDNVIPDAYQYDPAFEGQLFGCDLWVEVSGISQPPVPEDITTLTVIKHVVNNDQTENKSAADFTMHVSGTDVSDPDFPGAESPGTTVTLDPGAFSVSEDPMTGYSAIFTGDCAGVIAAGQNLTCTVENNDNPPPTPETGQLTVIKTVEGGNKTVNDFPLFVDGMSITSGLATTTSASSHTVSETSDPDYSAVFSGDCNSSGVVNVPAGGSASCTITNTRDVGTITVHKVVNNNEVGTKSAADFSLTIDGTPVAQDTAITVTTGSHTVSEVDNMGYTKTVNVDCAADGTIAVAKDEAKHCTVTNNFPFFTVTVTKAVNNIHGGNNVIGDFHLFVGSAEVTSGVPKKVAVGTHLVSESGVGGYDGVLTGDCDTSTQLLTGANGDFKTCTMTNTDFSALITLHKSVVGGPAVPTDFIMRVDGIPVSTGSTKSVSSNAGHTITEDAKTGYHFTSITGSAKCPAVLGGTATLDEGESITCTITNTVD